MTALRAMTRCLFVLVGTTVLFSMPSASAQTLTVVMEDFNDYLQGFYPPAPSTARPEGWTFTTNGGFTNEVELTTAQNLGGQSLHVGGHVTGSTGGTADLLSFTINTSNMNFACDGSDVESFEFDWFLTGGPGTSGNGGVTYQFQLTNPTDSSRWVLTVPMGTANMVPAVITSTGASASGPALGLSSNEWWHITILMFDCGEQAFAVSKQRTADGSGFGASTINGLNLAGALSPPKNFLLDLQFTGGNSGTLSLGDTYVENIEAAYGAAAVGELGHFCADPTAVDYGGDVRADFGYNYVDSAAYFEDGVQLDEDSSEAFIDFSEGFVLESDDSGGNDPASMGKGWTGSVKEGEVWFRLEAGTDGRDSNFRAVFSFDGAVPSTSSVGNVRTTGSFQDHVAARVKEVGGDWRINLEFVSGGNGPFQVGGAYIGLNPNTADTFIFRVDTHAETPYFSIEMFNGEARQNLGLNESLDQVVSGFDLGAKINNNLYAQWFVAEGGSSLLGDAYTYLDDNDQATPYNSTCIFLGPGSSLTGHKGANPGSLTLDVDERDEAPSASFSSWSTWFDRTTPMGQLTWLALIGLGGAVALWMLTGGRVHRRDGGMPDIIPGSTPATLVGGYVGMWVAVGTTSPLWWYIPVFVTVVAAGVLAYLNKRGA